MGKGQHDGPVTGSKGGNGQGQGSGKGRGQADPAPLSVQAAISERLDIFATVIGFLLRRSDESVNSTSPR